MKASVRWLNRYLEPADLTPDEAERVLTEASFPIDDREDLPPPESAAQAHLDAGDARLEVEVTSNRGDCLSQVGLARELAARTGRRLIIPPPTLPSAAPARSIVEAQSSLPRGGRIEDVIRLENTVPELCPRFTVQVIRNVKVGPSPSWLVEALESVGQRSINNIVDITNFINFELGHPCHAFDLNKLTGPALVIRMASKGEALTTLDGRSRKLAGDEVVVADTQRAQSLAGVIGGADSEVSESTTDVVLEVATWTPPAVRRAARRHQVRTDSSHRFERYVDWRTLDHPAARAAALMIEVAGGQICEGVLDQGQRFAPLRTIEMRPNRCRALLGTHVPDDVIVRILEALEIRPEPQRADGEPIFRCTIPPFRPDLVREVDLIEEIARMHGFEHIPVHPRMNFEVKHPQESELAVRELTRILASVGFYETVTFSFTSPGRAKLFLGRDQGIIAVDDERRKQEPALRPSTLPGLLSCRRANQDAGVEAPGGVRLFEIASTFAAGGGDSGTVAGIVEQRTLALLMDVPGVGRGKAGSVDQQQKGLRILRGGLEAASQAVAGEAIELVPCAAPTRAFDAAAVAEVMLRGKRIGYLGLVAAEVQKAFDLDLPQVAAEIELDGLLASYPPPTRIRPLPAFPGIERDLSLIVGEDVRWEALRRLVESARLDRLEAVEFVGSYRGKQIGAGKKSVTLRMRFRDPSRTLRHEEVDPQVATVVDLAGRDLGARLRA